MRAAGAQALRELDGAEHDIDQWERETLQLQMALQAGGGSQSSGVVTFTNFRISSKFPIVRVECRICRSQNHGQLQT